MQITIAVAGPHNSKQPNEKKGESKMLEKLAGKLKMPMKSASVDGPKSLDDEFEAQFGEGGGAEEADVKLSEASVEQLEAALAEAKAKAGDKSEDGDDGDAEMAEDDDDMYA